jgi:hypothetical protein
MPLWGLRLGGIDSQGNKPFENVGINRLEVQPSLVKLRLSIFLASHWNQQNKCRPRGNRLDYRGTQTNKIMKGSPGYCFKTVALGLTRSHKGYCELGLQVGRAQAQNHFPGPTCVKRRIRPGQVKMSQSSAQPMAQEALLGMGPGRPKGSKVELMFLAYILQRKQKKLSQPNLTKSPPGGPEGPS